MADETATRTLQRLAIAKDRKQPHEGTWRDCFDFCFPERGDGINGEKIDAENAKTKQAKLLDGTSTDSGQILASAIVGGGTPANSQWFGLSTGQDTDEEALFFDFSAEFIFQHIHASNYDAVGFECSLDMIPAGWFVMMIEEADDGGFQFEELPIGNCCIAASKPGGIADILFYEYELTAEQAVSFFNKPGDQLSDKVHKLISDEKPDEKVKFVRHIYPRTGPHGMRSKNLPFASVHVEVSEKKTARESGYHECPFVAPRWSKLPKSDYPIGPMFRALPDTKQLNRLVQMEEANADLALSGMWIAEDDGVLNPRTVKVGPRKIIIANSVDSMKPLKSGADFNLSFTKKEQLQAAIRKILMADQLSPQDGPVRSATEVHVRVQMIRQLLGPIYGRLQAEWYKPMIERCFGIAFRAGVLPVPPESLNERQFTAVFQSPMAKAQKLEEVNAVESTLASVGGIAAAKQDPTVWDNIDVDESIRIIRDGRGAPARINRDKKDVATIRENRQKEQEQAIKQQQQNELTQKTAPIAMQNMAAA